MPTTIPAMEKFTMMTLTTVSKKTSNNSALVFWRVGTKRKGILDVRIDFDHEEADLLAELVAIRYLALDKQGVLP